MSSTVLLDEPDVLRILYDEDNGIQVHEWLDYNPEDDDAVILGLLDRIYALLIARPVEKLLVIADRTRGAFSPAVQRFIRDVQFPRIASDTRLRFVATVTTPGRSMLRVATDVWSAQAGQPGTVLMEEVASVDEGIAWLRGAAQRFPLP